ncbi:C40 family peptidase [Streptomyces ochraceiscleroticus]|uniref:NlpC/P60 family protein n=1 Tax=Streptomyces ochraceiscleroticus TaxID=47761 RepID=A0ABW1MCQ3_9ACTN|nr:C40 family peptidase [Streptomyces ochraceiscleroticus]
MRGRFRRSVGSVALLGAVAVALPAAPVYATSRPAAPPDIPVSELLTRLQKLYQQTEAATEAYNATEEDLKAQAKLSKKLDGRLRAARSDLAQGRADAGRLAREQYTGSGPGGLSPYVQFLLSKDPEQALDRGHLLKEAAGHQADTVTRLAGSAKKANELATKAKKALDRKKSLADRRKKQKAKVEGRLREVETMLSSLSPQQLAELSRLERAGMEDAQQAFLGSGALGGPQAPSKGGQRAMAYALTQVGKPYVWGAEGPDSFDCSGLTSQAWAHAGKPIPRTSQEQWKQLPHVSLRELRPGDLVIYFPGATHVAMYLGDGMVVQAPRPGAKVKISPIAANPLLGAVRPDEDAAGLKDYTPPELPDGATDGDDTGYGDASAPGD